MARNVKGVYQKQSQNLEKAIDAVQTKGMSIRKAAEMYEVKRSTLGDQISGRVVNGRKSGRNTVFTLDVERQIVQKADLASQQGFGISIKQLIRKAGTLAKSMKIKTPFKNGVPGQAWWDGFKRRNPQLVLRKAEKLSSTRARNLNKPQVIKYFEDLNRQIEALDLREKPLQYGTWTRRI